MIKFSMSLLVVLALFGCGGQETKQPAPAPSPAPPDTSASAATPVVAPTEPAMTAFVPPVRLFPQAIVIADEKLPGHIDSILQILNEPDNHLRRTTGEELAALPATALPHLKKRLAQDDQSWVALASLNKAIELIELRESGKQMSDAEATDIAWARKILVESYEQHGKRSPKWDRDVIEALEWWALYTARASTRHEGIPNRVQPLLSKAQRAGCDDGLVHFILMLAIESFSALPTPAMAGDEYYGYEKAARLIGQSNYPPIIKARAFISAARNIHRVDATKAGMDQRTMQASAQSLAYLNRSFDAFEQAVAAGGMPVAAVIEFVDTLLDTAAQLQRNRDQWLIRVKPLIERNYADTGAMEAIEGTALVDWAWDARGTGFADTVTPEGAGLFHVRLRDARPFLTAAMEKYPNQPALSERLMVTLFADEFDAQLFDKALKVYARGPLGDGTIIGTILHYLTPKWGGSPQRVIDFARMALLTGNWENRLPYYLVESHMYLARYKAPDFNNELLSHPVHFSDPEVWTDMQLVCEKMLKQHPDDRLVKTAYLYAACGAEKWDIAHQFFNQLGDNGHYRYVRNQDVYREMKAKVRSIVVKPVEVNADGIDTDEKLRELMVKMVWNLDYFSVGGKRRRKVEWTFSADGRLTDRVQPNWKIEDGVLSTFPDDKRMYNRWKFNLAERRWENVDNKPEDPDKNAYLIPIATR